MQCTNLGGMEQVSYQVMNALSRESNQSFRITSPRPFGAGEEIVKIFDPDARGFAYRGRFGWRTYPEFSRHTKNISNECSHVWVTGTCAASLMAVKQLKLPKVLSHHYHHFEGRWSWIKWRSFYEMMTHQVNAITYPTRFTRDEALKIAPWLKDKAVVVPNSFKVNFVDETSRQAAKKKARAALDLPINAYIVGNAGWLIQRKRFDIFLRTAAAIKRRIPESYFIICGGGELEVEMKKLAHSLGISECVRFEGWVKDLEPYYRAWDVILFNSDFDALGCTPLEAASYGCPVVASVKYGGLSEFIDSGRNGYLFEDHDIKLLASAVCELAEDDSLACSFRDEAADTLRREYSENKGIQFYQDFFSC